MKTYTQAWQKIANKATAVNVVQHIALKAFFAQTSNETNREEIFQSQARRAFTEVTNENKLVNGNHPFQGLKKALWIASMSLSDGLLGMKDQESVDTIFSGSEEAYKEFKNFLRILNILSGREDGFDKYKRRNYSYIFVDKRFDDPIYQAVQAAHVAMVIGQKMNKSFDAHKIHFQVCEMPEQYDHIEVVAAHLEAVGFRVEGFYEHDVDRIIAIGTHPVPSHKRKELRASTLLTF